MAIYSRTPGSNVHKKTSHIYFFMTENQPRENRVYAGSLHFSSEWGWNHNYMVHQPSAIKEKGQLLAKLILC